MDLDRNGVHDALDGAIGPVWIGLSYGTTVDEGHVAAVEALGLPVELVVPAVDALLLGQVDASMIPTLRALDDVVGRSLWRTDLLGRRANASRQGEFFFRLSRGAWDLGVSGEGIVIAMVDTGVDNEHLDEREICRRVRRRVLPAQRRAPVRPRRWACGGRLF